MCFLRAKVGKKLGFLRAIVGEADQLVPPVKGWQFNEDYGTNWSSDTTLKCSRNVSELCTEIAVELHGEVKQSCSSLEGTYRPVEGVVVRGRPVGYNDDHQCSGLLSLVH